MPINKLALIRYKTIDNCLQNRFRKWTLEDLMECCCDALYEYEGITSGISRRTIQLDIQNMRSEKLGYNAPIVVTDKKFYSYSEKNYSITNIPLTTQDISTLNEVLGVLKQFKGFSYFRELDGMVTRLEDKLVQQKNKGRSFIDFEKNELLKGIGLVDPLHKAILNEKVLEIVYQSFKARVPQSFVFYPYLLKEYRNRWFLLGVNNRRNETLILALDRMERIRELDEVPYVKPSFNVKNYFNDVIGVTKMPGQKPQLIVLRINKADAPYIITKPIHTSQKLLKEEKDFMIFSLEVIWNYELEREILGFGNKIKILSPKRLAGKIISVMKETLESYRDKETIPEAVHPDASDAGQEMNTVVYSRPEEG